MGFATMASYPHTNLAPTAPIRLARYNCLCQLMVYIYTVLSYALAPR